MSTASDHRCVFFGRTAENLHHLSGRDANGNYIYPGLVVPIVRSQHGVLHKAWNANQIGEGSNRAPLALAHYRIGQDLGLLGDHHHEGLVVLPAFVLSQLGLVHRSIAERFGTMG